VGRAGADTPTSLTGEGEGEGAHVEGANEGHEEEGTIGSDTRGARTLPELVN